MQKKSARGRAAAVAVAALLGALALAGAAMAQQRLMLSPEFGGISNKFSDGSSARTATNVPPTAWFELTPSSGSVGTEVKITGSHLTYATAVGFSGAYATFKVVSPSEILTTVPRGATTGDVQVFLPGTQIVRSRVPFEVTP